MASQELLPGKDGGVEGNSDLTAFSVQPRTLSIVSWLTSASPVTGG